MVPFQGQVVHIHSFQIFKTFRLFCIRTPLAKRRYPMTFSSKLTIFSPRIEKNKKTTEFDN